jgi:hypothetical protein
MHAELGSGRDMNETHRRWGLGMAERAEVDEHYTVSFQRDPRVQAAWERANKKYRAALRRG